MINIGQRHTCSYFDAARITEFLSCLHDGLSSCGLYPLVIRGGLGYSPCSYIRHGSSYRALEIA